MSMANLGLKQPDKGDEFVALAITARVPQQAAMFAMALIRLGVPFRYETDGVKDKTGKTGAGFLIDSRLPGVTEKIQEAQQVLLSFMKSGLPEGERLRQLWPKEDEFKGEN